MALSLILVPLLGAALMPILRKIWSKGTTVVAALITLYLLFESALKVVQQLAAKQGLLTDQVVLGNRMILNIDGLSLVVLLSISLVALVTVLFAGSFPLDPDRRPGFYALVLLAVTGMNGLVMSADLFSLFVFLEILSVSSFVLIAFQLDGLGIEGSFKYMMLSAVATVFLLIGIALVFAVTGSVTFSDLSFGLKSGAPIVKLAMSVIFFALVLKAGVMPFHAWLPDAYTSAPAPVSILLGGIVTKVAGVYTLIRVFTVVFGFSKSFSTVLLILGTVSMVLGAFMALGQRDFKRMLSFSSISQIGYIMLGFALGTPLGLIGAVFHFFNHAVFKSLLFLNAGSVELATGTRKFDDLGGLAKKMPVTGVTSVIGMLSTAGIPPLAGFWSKVIIIIALWASGYQLLAMLAILTSLVTLSYLLSLQREVFFGKLKEGLEGIKEVSPLAYWPAILMAAIAIGTGIFFPFVLDKLVLPVNTLLGMLVK